MIEDIDDVDELKTEIFRLADPSLTNKNLKARWQLMYKWSKEGKSYAQIAAHFGLKESTVRQVIKYNVNRALCFSEIQWPKDVSGRYICDIQHPMPPVGERDDDGASAESCCVLYTHDGMPYWKPRLPIDPEEWCHVRAKNKNYCPVCKQHDVGLPFKPKTLVEVFGSSKA